MDSNQLPVTPQSPQNQPTVPINSWYKASIVRRYFALVIDTLLFLPINIGVLILAVSIAKGIHNIYISAFISKLFPYLIFAAYNVLFIWKYGATLGKRWLKIKVVNTNYQPLSLGQALLRETIGKFLSGIIFSLGYLSAIWDKNRQGWHDKIAKTYVVTSIPTSDKNQWWLIFLAGFLLIIPALAILAAVVVLIINPLDVTRRGRDSARLADLSNVKQAIELVSVSSAGNPFLCKNIPSPCEGQTQKLNIDHKNINIDGTGWVKIDFSNQQATGFKVLPVDPVNSSIYFYRYCSNGTEWELDARFESDKNKSRAENDGGDDPLIYEIGNNLKLCSSSNRSNL